MVKIWTNSFKRNKRNHFAAKMLWLFITLTTFSATMQGQQSEKRISLEFKNERLADAFKKIEAASGYKFIFNYEDIFVYGVTGIIKSKTITETLDEVIGKKPLVYKINGKFITIALNPEVRRPRQKPGCANWTALLLTKTNSRFPEHTSSLRERSG